jgi:hypothetical protein
LLFSLMFGIGWLALASWGRSVMALAFAAVMLLLLSRVKAGRARLAE